MSSMSTLHCPQPVACILLVHVGRNAVAVDEMLSSRIMSKHLDAGSWGKIKKDPGSGIKSLLLSGYGRLNGSPQVALLVAQRFGR